MVREDNLKDIGRLSSRKNGSASREERDKRRTVRVIGALFQLVGRFSVLSENLRCSLFSSANTASLSWIQYQSLDAGVQETFRWVTWRCNITSTMPWPNFGVMAGVCSMACRDILKCLKP